MHIRSSNKASKEGDMDILPFNDLINLKLTGFPTGEKSIL